MKWRGFLSLLASAALYGTFGVLIRILSSDLSSFQQIIFRNLIGFILVSLVLTIYKIPFNFKGVSRIKLFVYTVSFPLGVVLFTFSVLSGKITVSVFSLYVGSILTSLLIGRLFFGERLSWAKVASLILVFLGLGLFSWPISLNNLSVSFLFGLVSGAFDATANACRKSLSGKTDRFVLTSLQMLGGVVVASLILLSRGNSSLLPAQISAVSWGVGLAFGLILILVNYLLLFGFEHFDLNLGTVVLSSELFVATFFGFIFFAEKPTLLEFSGEVFILLAVAVANLGDRR